MAHYKYNEYKKIYEINKLAFDGQNALKNSNYIQNIIIPSQSLLDTNNPNRDSQYARLIGQASYINYPQLCLENCLGLCQKGQPEITLPERMKSLIDYATSQKQPLTALQVRSLESLFKYGLACIKIDIVNDAPITELPKFKVIDGNKIVDFKTIKDVNGNDVFKFVLLDETKRLFYEPTKIYIIKRRYKVCGIDQNGQYYQALIQNSRWNNFNLNRPWESDTIELVYPEFFGRLDFVPIVIFNPQTVRFNQNYNYEFTSAIQNLINLSLNIFQQDGNLKSSLHLQANPSLYIAGSTAKPKDILIGPYSCNIFKDAGSKMEYASPDFGGITIQQEVLNAMKVQANSMIYSIINAASNSSGDALALRVQASTLNLVAMVKNIGDAITNALQLMALILGENPDDCLYSPYLGFGDVKTDTSIKEEVLNNMNSEQTQEKQEETEENLDFEKKV